MARLALAILCVAALMAGLLILLLGLYARRKAGPEHKSAEEAGSFMQKVAFAVLVALILYAGIQGAAL